ncbi:pentapeptide repeat-containing protein [Halovenus salina]|uniref:Pentapeptide repeat-containing protein n=1 Tax=Halovenus salina TaxID=1510225 RepID=A0ABD5W3M2_9EURY|nr:pentapeptide repeat-containing protein [Halovenus salina]
MATECGYTHDVSSERFEDMPGDQWKCSQPATGGDRCVFHADPDTVSDETVRESFLNVVATEKGAVRLIGTRLSSLSVDYAILDGPSNHPIDLRESVIGGGLSARYVTVKRPLRLDGARLEGIVNLEDAVFSRRVDFGDTVFGGRVSFRLVNFESALDLRDADFHEPAYMRLAVFQRGIYGVGVTFHAAADFLNTRFEDVCNFYRASFHSGAIFDSSTFAGGNAQFFEAEIDSPAVKLDSAMDNPRSEREYYEDIALSMDGVTCDRDLRLAGATLGGDVVFTSSDLGRDLKCGDLSTTDHIVVNCSGTTVVTGKIGGSNDRVTYDFTDATVGEIDIADDASFDMFRFDETTFSGFDFGAYKQELAVRDWRLHDASTDYSPTRLENLYLRAKNGANEIGETRAAAEFFIYEMVYRRRNHYHLALTGSSIRERLRAASKWVSNTALQFSCGYGERPFRPVVFSMGLIVAFASLYALLGAPVVYPGFLGYLTFSIEGFVSLVLGLPDVTNPVLGFFVAVEGFLGGFIIALFVFTLTRSISR